MVSTPESPIQETEVQRRQQALSALLHDSATLLKNPKNIQVQQHIIKRVFKSFMSSPVVREYEMILPEDNSGFEPLASWEGLYDSSITEENPKTLGFTRIQFNAVTVLSENEKPQKVNLAINFRRSPTTFSLDRGGLSIAISDQEIESSLKQHIAEVRKKVQPA